MARMLTSLGIPCGHESIFNQTPYVKENLSGKRKLGLSECSLDSCEKWIDIENIVADSSYMAVPYLDLIPETPLIHVVRDPLLVISSFVRDFDYFKSKAPGENDYQKLIYSTLPDLKSIKNPVERAAYFYVSWNRLIEEQSRDRKLFFKIESDDVKSVADFLNKEVPEGVFNGVEVNSRKTEKNRFSLADIPEGSIKNSLVKMSVKYGYAGPLLL